ncbi:MAG: glycosyltransferase [Candidatus Krumholzibacteriia bacterium]
MARPDLSLCLIVRDEAAMLPGFLAAADGLADELVAVDTGSRDRTLDLLAAAGARVVRHRWQEDFAAARNAALDAAAGRWILVLDADERPTAALVAQVRALLADPAAGAATLVMRNALPAGGHKDADLLRLFRNDPQIRYRHAIHEDASAGVAAFLAATGLVQRRLGGVVHHLGYVRDHAAARAKQDRDTAILRRLVAADPGDLYSWYKLLEQARFWDDRALRAATAPAAAAAFAAADAAWLGTRPWSGDLAAMLAEAADDDPAARLVWLAANRDRTAPTAAWHLARARWLEATGDLTGADAAARDGEVAARDGSAHLAVRARLLRARLAAAAGDLAAARDLATAAADAVPTDAEALLAGVAFSRAAGGEPGLQAFVAARRAADPHADPDLARALLGAGQPAAAAGVLADLALADPAAALGLLVCALVTGEPFDRTLDLDQDAADAALREWVGLLWESRRTDLMAAFADRAPSVTGAFPWLPEFLAERTRRLSSSRR